MDDIDKMLELLVKLTPEEQAAKQPLSKNARKKLWRDQPPDPNSNTSRKKERNRLAARTPAQIRKDELIEEKKRLSELAKKARIDVVAQQLDKGAGKERAIRKEKQRQAVARKRKRRSQ